MFVRSVNSGTIPTKAQWWEENSCSPPSFFANSVQAIAFLQDFFGSCITRAHGLNLCLAPFSPLLQQSELFVSLKEIQEDGVESDLRVWPKVREASTRQLWEVPPHLSKLLRDYADPTSTIWSVSLTAAFKGESESSEKIPLTPLLSLALNRNDSLEVPVWGLVQISEQCWPLGDSGTGGESYFPQEKSTQSTLKR